MAMKLLDKAAWEVAAGEELSKTEPHKVWDNVL
jgi:hypothetical protein